MILVVSLRQLLRIKSIKVSCPLSVVPTKPATNFQATAGSIAIASASPQYMVSASSWGLFVSVDYGSTFLNANVLNSPSNTWSDAE